ncbi:MAG: glycosyl hydrolase family protein [Acinetobacter sp.]|nr:MAG: glycosyl hydrolase family protein [Acinetobacter sp.]
MKTYYYLACALAITLCSCQKTMLLTDEQSAKLKLTDKIAEVPAKETDTLLPGSPPDPAYQMMFADYFDSNHINTDSLDWWVPRYKGNDAYIRKNNFNGYNRISANSVADGKLSISFTRETLPGQPERYIGGGIISTKTFGYGYYEAKVKLYTGSYGLHQSFWSAAGAIEIDGFEMESKTKNELSRLIANVHRWSPNNAYYTATGTPTEYTNNPTVPGSLLVVPAPATPTSWAATDGIWCTVGYEWLPDRIKYYVNGILTNTYLLGTNFNKYQPAVAMLTALPLKKYTDVDMVPPLPGAAMMVSYFTYYTKRLDDINLLGNSKFDYISIAGNTNNVTKESKATAWSESPLQGVLSGSTVNFGSSVADSANAYVVKDGTGNWYLEHKNTTGVYSAETSQKLNFILPGTYNFSAKIRSSGSGARFIILDKNKNVILNRVIQNAYSYWLTINNEITIPSNEVTVLVYSDAQPQGSWLNVDDISFARKP